ncbi:MAG: glycyl-radical enzyme activating protein [Deltaproteobacteria bacterium]|nr:MAG: glycyl-radical enzyme activating protein [Deltaproteobacteria bacterium]
MKGLVANIQKFSIHDGPGIRTTVFVKGCPLRCKWCDNPETWEPYPQIMFVPLKCHGCGKCAEVCPEGAISLDKEGRIDRERCTLCMQCVDACKYGALRKVGMEMTPEEVVNVVEEDRIFYTTSDGGMTISGGEPLAQPDFVSEIFRLCKMKGIHTALDTSGYAKPEAVEKVLRYVDLVLLDIKHMDPEEHKRWTGVSNELILKNAELMAQRREVRISLPLVKGVNTSERNLRETAEFAKALGIKAIDIEPLHKLAEQKYKFLGLESPFADLEKISDEEVEEIRELFHSYGLETTKGRAF